jgi:threonylcarbamoyladenosine tRNA methylthiotransferase MtaB
LLSDKKKRAFYEQFADSTQRVLWEASEDEGFMYGFTENYLKVTQPYTLSAVNEITEVKLGKLNSDSVFSIG